MVEFEKRGIPTVSWTSSIFVEDAYQSSENFGLSDLRIAVVEEPFTSSSQEIINESVEGAIDQVIAGLCEPEVGRHAGTGDHDKYKVTVVNEDWLTFQGDDLLEASAAMDEQFRRYGWSDGFPLVPVTQERLDWMMSGTKRSPDDIVAVLEPGFGLATVRKIAANAVMAGCRPEHLPVIIVAVECLADPVMYLRNKAMSTGPAAPLLIVNGPIRERIGMNAQICALGPGSISYVNTVIGRAVRLCMMNVGHTYPGISDMDTNGSPAKYSLCAPEYEEANPWEPFHVERGFDRSTSTVTVQFVYGITDMIDLQNHDPEALCEAFSTIALNVCQASSGNWLIGRRADPRYGTEEKEHHMLMLGPEHAHNFARAGWDKKRIKQEMHRRARLPFRTLFINKEPEGLRIAHPELTWLFDSPDALVPVLEDEDCWDITVVGGGVARGTFFFGSGEPIIRPIGE